MDKRKAISILERQKEKITPPPFYSSLWLTQTKTFIDLFFGGDSHEAAWLKDFRFHTYVDKENKEANNNHAAIKFLDNCIETIKDKGLKKREWKHIIMTTHPAIFWSVFIALLGFSFWLGKVTANKGDNTTYNKPTPKNDSVHKKDLSLMWTSP